MDDASKKELRRRYKEKNLVPGVFQVKNHANGKVLLGSSLNIAGPLNAHEFMLSINSHRNKELQADYHSFGANAFSFDILGIVKVTDDAEFNLEVELKTLEQLWLDELKPVGEGGYNPTDNIRQA